MAPGTLASPLRPLPDLTVRQILRLAAELEIAPAALLTGEPNPVRDALEEELARLVGWKEP